MATIIRFRIVETWQIFLWFRIITLM